MYQYIIISIIELTRWMSNRYALAREKGIAQWNEHLYFVINAVGDGEQ